MTFPAGELGGRSGHRVEGQRGDLDTGSVDKQSCRSWSDARKGLDAQGTAGVLAVCWIYFDLLDLLDRPNERPSIGDIEYR
ncbi:hypothetical protein [Nocardia sp. R6R-6]|uniref:hypothetical protein n=1 Tax=Nocardia sp. R6R-6 TaxID=3459303 RepID=UPI00403E1803